MAIKKETPTGAPTQSNIIIMHGLTQPRKYWCTKCNEAVNGEQKVIEEPHYELEEFGNVPIERFVENVCEWCGGDVDPAAHCSVCGEPISPYSVEPICAPCREDLDNAINMAIAYIKKPDMDISSARELLIDRLEELEGQNDNEW